MNLKLSLCDLLVIGEVKQGGKKSSSIPALGDSVQAGGERAWTGHCRGETPCIGAFSDKQDLEALKKLTLASLLAGAFATPSSLDLSPSTRDNLLNIPIQIDTPTRYQTLDG